MIPSNEVEWLTRTEALGVDHVTINRCEDLKSGSRSDEMQFLAMRVLYVDHEASELDIESWGLSGHIERARPLLSTDFPEFGRYLERIDEKAGTTEKGPDDQLAWRIFEIPRAA